MTLREIATATEQWSLETDQNGYYIVHMTADEARETLRIERGVLEALAEAMPGRALQ